MSGLLRATEGFYVGLIFRKRGESSSLALRFSLGTLGFGLLLLYGLFLSESLWLRIPGLLVCLLNCTISLRFVLFLAGALRLYRGLKANHLRIYAIASAERIFLSIPAILSFLLSSFIALGICADILMNVGAVAAVNAGQTGFDAIGLNPLDTNSLLTPVTTLGRQGLMLLYLSKLVILSLVVPLFIAVILEPLGLTKTSSSTAGTKPAGTQDNE